MLRNFLRFSVNFENCSWQVVALSYSIHFLTKIQSVHPTRLMKMNNEVFNCGRRQCRVIRPSYYFTNPYRQVVHPIIIFLLIVLESTPFPRQSHNSIITPDLPLILSLCSPFSLTLSFSHSLTLPGVSTEPLSAITGYRR